MKLYEITHCKFYIFIFIGILIVTTAELTIRTQLFSDIFTPPLMLYMFTQLIIFMFSASIIHEIGHYLTALLINQKSKPFFKNWYSMDCENWSQFKETSQIKKNCLCWTNFQYRKSSICKFLCILALQHISVYINLMCYT